MTITAPTFSQIKAQVTAIRKKVPNARTIGLRSYGRWVGENLRQDGNEQYLIRQCDSPLAIRLALREETDAATTKVLITSLDDRELSDDILVRLAKRRVFAIDSRQIVQSLFEAHAIDPRLTRHSWLADTLLDLLPSEGYPAARGGFLDAETVWSLLLSRAFALGDNPDLTSLVKWSLDADAVARFQSAPSDFRNGAIEWLNERAGPAAEAVLRCIERLERVDVLALGLASGVILHPAAAGHLDKAVGKIEERYFGGRSPESSALGRWSSAATDVVRLLGDPKLKRQQLQRADQILHEVQADAYAFLSDVLPTAFDQRLARFGTALLDGVQQPKPDKLEALREARRDVQKHDFSGREQRRVERIEMALRLVRWLADRQADSLKPFRSLAQAASDHLRYGGFVDWARLALRAGDPVRELSEAYTKLFDDVTSIQEQQARHFAELLRDWTAAGSTGSDVIPVEQILDRIVAPLAAEAPVLVIVIDGMSVAVCRELLADLTRHEWLSLSEPGQKFTRPGIAAIPSVTEISRTSLLCGRLQRGFANDERAGFAEHPALLAQCRANYSPVLFHKPSLQESGDAGLATEVRNEIASAQRRIVGVVVNAVDDHLLKGEQIDTRWSRDEIKVLPILLDEARNARRLVVIVSDHGHVLDRQTQMRPNEGGERWRPDNGRPESDELRVAGARVLADGASSLIAPWSEKVRFGIKKNGYHGGLTPQEMIVPIVVLSSSEKLPAGWSEAPIETPPWWDDPVQIPAAVEPSPHQLKKVKPKPPETLFDMSPEEQATLEPAKSEVVPGWVSRLLKSPVFEDQRRLGGRAIPKSDVFETLLVTLDSRGGKMTSVALARAMDYPPMRLLGLIAIVQRVLNVDGYPVIARDEASDTIQLNRELLLQQFDLV